MNTPVVDFVRRYAQQRTTRMHMPGHKGRGPLGCEELDITEIAGADELYEAEGIIAQSEANATQLFGTARTYYSTVGSSAHLTVLRGRRGERSSSTKEKMAASGLSR